MLGACSFLNIDPDLGLELVANEFSTGKSDFIRINVNLDSSSSLDKGVNNISLFELIVPVFQLLCSVLISMGSTNKSVIQSVRKLLVKFRKLLVGVFRREALTKQQDAATMKYPSSHGLEEMVKLIVILCTLTGYRGEDTVPNLIE